MRGRDKEKVCFKAGGGGDRKEVRQKSKVKYWRDISVPTLQ